MIQHCKDLRLGTFEYDDEQFCLKNINGKPCLCYIGKEVFGSKIIIPKGISSCAHMFRNTKIVTAPKIPEGVIDCTSTFESCRNLKKAHMSLPIGVKLCHAMFYDCENLEVAPEIPITVTDCSYMFADCINLKKLLTTQMSGMVTNCKFMFKNCPNLETYMNPNLSNKEEVFNMYKGCPKILCYLLFS